MNRIRCMQLGLMLLFSGVFCNGGVILVGAFQSMAFMPSFSVQSRAGGYRQEKTKKQKTYSHLLSDIRYRRRGKNISLMDLNLEIFQKPAFPFSTSMFMVPHENGDETDKEDENIQKAPAVENKAKDENDWESRRRMELYQMPIAKLCSILERSDITIPITASRQNLVDLIINYEKVDDTNINNRNKSQRRGRGQRTENGDDEERSNGMSDRDRRNRRRRSQRKNNYENVNNSYDDDDDQVRQRRQRQRRRKMRQQRNNSPNNQWDEIVSNEFLTPTARATAKIAKSIGRQAVDGVTNVADNLSKKDLMERYRNGIFNRDDDDDNVDENGVREVDWYYVNRNYDNNVKDTDDVDAGRDRRRQESRDRPKGRPWPRTQPASRPSKQRRPKTTTISRNDRKSVDDETMNIKDTNKDMKTEDKDKRKRRPIMGLLPSSTEDVVYIPDLNTDSNEDTQSTSNRKDRDSREEVKKSTISGDRESRPRPRPRPRGGPRKAQKKVYSAYPPNTECDDDESLADLELLYGKTAADAIDSVGEFVADVVEGKYFNNGTQTDAPRNKTPRRQKRKRRYWKDKLAERVDYALGVHEDGKYYKDWEEKLKLDRENEVDSNDPISIFYGRQKKKRRRGDMQRRRRARDKSKPFWEEDGSLMSLFFGRNIKGDDLAFNVSNPSLLAFSSSIIFHITVH